MLKIHNNFYRTLASALTCALLIARPALAETATQTATAQPSTKRAMLKNPLHKMSIFSDLPVKGFFETDTVVAVENEESKVTHRDEAVKQVEERQEPVAAETSKESENSATSSSAKKQENVPSEEASAVDPKGPKFVEKFKPSDLLPPDQNPQVRLNPQAPAPFIGMASAYHDGDMDLAGKYADQYVRYQQNLFFEVRQLSALIGKALVRQNVIKDDDLDGVQQYIDYFAAKDREQKQALIRPTQDAAMRQIKPDTAGRADVYFFFSLNCSYCRYMASDVERLWRATQNDPSIRLAGVTLDSIPEGWIEEYRRYTGSTFPILDGKHVAKAFDVRFVPAIVVRSPTNNRAYLKSGQQSFTNMYEFVRTVQGIEPAVTAEIQNIIDEPIGEMELERVRTGEWKISRFSKDEMRGFPMKQAVQVAMPKKSNQDGIGRF